MNRREFIRTTAVASVGLASMGNADSSAVPKRAMGLIDTNVSLGQWPFRRLALDETSALVKKLQHGGVTQAWAGSFGALLSRDLTATNAELAAECRKHGRGTLRPFGSVNPMSAGWEEELRRCASEDHMPGLRLYPGYHGYKLSDPAFAKLLKRAVESKLIVQIAAAMEDERTQHPLVKVGNLDATPLVGLLKEAPNARVMMLNWHRAVKPDLAKRLAAMGVCFDIATVENVGGVTNLVEEISAKQVVFGSHAPFFYFDAARLKLTESELSVEDEFAVCSGNAKRLLG